MSRLSVSDEYVQRTKVRKTQHTSVCEGGEDEWDEGEGDECDDEYVNEFRFGYNDDEYNYTDNKYTEKDEYTFTQTITDLALEEEEYIQTLNTNERQNHVNDEIKLQQEVEKQHKEQQEINRLKLIENEKNDREHKKKIEKEYSESISYLARISKKEQDEKLQQLIEWRRVKKPELFVPVILSSNEPARRLIKTLTRLVTPQHMLWSETDYTEMIKEQETVKKAKEEEEHKVIEQIRKQENKEFLDLKSRRTAGRITRFLPWLKSVRNNQKEETKKPEGMSVVVKTYVDNRCVIKTEYKTFNKLDRGQKDILQAKTQKEIDDLEVKKRRLAAKERRNLKKLTETRPAEITEFEYTKELIDIPSEDEIDDDTKEQSRV